MISQKEAAKHLRSWAASNHPPKSEWLLWQRAMRNLADKIDPVKRLSGPPRHLSGPPRHLSGPPKNENAIKTAKLSFQDRTTQRYSVVFIHFTHRHGYGNPPSRVRKPPLTGLKVYFSALPGRRRLVLGRVRLGPDYPGHHQAILNAAGYTGRQRQRAQNKNRSHRKAK